MSLIDLYRCHISLPEFFVDHLPHTNGKALLCLSPGHGKQPYTCYVILSKLTRDRLHTVRGPMVFLLEKTKEYLHGSWKRQKEQNMVKQQSFFIFIFRRCHNKRTSTMNTFELEVMYLSMLSPRGGGGVTPGICGAFDLYCLPHHREFD